MKNAMLSFAGIRVFFKVIYEQYGSQMMDSIKKNKKINVKRKKWLQKAYSTIKKSDDYHSNIVVLKNKNPYAVCTMDYMHILMFLTYFNATLAHIN